MTKENLYNKLLEIKGWCMQKGKTNYINTCEEEHLQVFAENLGVYFENTNFIDKFNFPVFNEEVVVNRIISFDMFSFLKEEQGLLKAAKQFLKTKVEDFLIVLGQRLTSATIRDENALPPLDKNVFEASFEAYNQYMSKALRAFEKHSERTTNNFWGTIEGNPKQKEEKVRQLVLHILENKSWWNVFYHFKHELIYEVRIPSGHGARWKKSDLEFIGFVEPFLEQFRNLN